MILMGRAGTLPGRITKRRIYSMKASELVEELKKLIEANGDYDVLVDTGMALCELDAVDMGGSDEGIVLWSGDLVEGP
jgi:hypothetical protein